MLVLNIIVNALQAFPEIFSPQVESFQNLKLQEKFLASPMGKGILLMSLSLIKYRSRKYYETEIFFNIIQYSIFNIISSWYSVMKANYNEK